MAVLRPFPSPRSCLDPILVWPRRPWGLPQRPLINLIKFAAAGALLIMAINKGKIAAGAANEFVPGSSSIYCVEQVDILWVLLQGSQIGHFVTKLKSQTRSFAAAECHSLLWPKATYRRTYVIIIRGCVESLGCDECRMCVRLVCVLKAVSCC